MHNVWRLIFSVHSYTVRVLELCLTAYTIDNESSSISVLCVSHACAHPIPLEAAFRAAAQARVITRIRVYSMHTPLHRNMQYSGNNWWGFKFGSLELFENQPNLIPHRI